MYLTKRYFGRLNKKQTEEIGTIKSPTKPLYLMQKRVEELNILKEEIDKLRPLKNALEEQIKNMKKEITEEETILKVLENLESVKNSLSLEEEKINIYEKSKEELYTNKEELVKELKQIRPAREKGRVSNLVYIIPGILGVLAGVLFAIKQIMFGGIASIISILTLSIIILKNIKEKNDYKKDKEEVAMQKQVLESKIEIIENEINTKENLIKETKDNIEKILSIKKEEIKIKYPIASKINMDKVEGENNLFEEQNYINELKLNLGKKEIEQNQLNERIEKLSEIEERLKSSEEALDELIKYNEIIDIAKEALDAAYLEMKESITPKFTKNLSNLIDCITDGKYKRVKINEDNKLLLETENRKLYRCQTFKSRNYRSVIFVT